MQVQISKDELKKELKRKAWKYFWEMKSANHFWVRKRAENLSRLYCDMYRSL